MIMDLNGKKIAAIAIIAAIGFFPGMLAGFFIPKEGEEYEIYITTVEDGQEIHSKIWIDASFPPGITKKEVLVNDSLKADYTPYLWNNIEEKAGRYSIKVKAWDTAAKLYSTEITVVIPVSESFVGDRNNFTEDHVIHEGQDISWKDGIFNLSRTEIDNGGHYYDKVDQYVDVFGNLTITNCTVIGAILINLKGIGRLTITDSVIDSKVYASGLSVFTGSNVDINAVYLYMNSTHYRHNCNGTLVVQDNSTVINT